MSYTIIRSDSSTLTTIADGTINTTTTSLGLPGRNFAGYGNIIDTNFVRILENFANDTPPANPLKGQLWFDTRESKLKVCPTDGTTVSSDWIVLTGSNSLGDATLGNLTVTGAITGNTLTSITTTSVGTDLTVVGNATIGANITATLANVATANIGATYTRVISTGAAGTSGTMTGSWTVSGSSSGNAFNITSGNIALGASQSIRCGNYLNADGTAWVPSGTYTNANVSDFLTGANSVTRFTGNIAPTKVTTTVLAGSGTIEGSWTLAQGATFAATYSADVAERYAADAIYEPGTVLQIGGDFEVTAVKEELSEEVFGVVSTDPAYILNDGAGTDETHPKVALAGRVPVKVIGKVAKGQRLVAAGNGFARAGTKEELTAFNVIGRALAAKDTDGEGVVEAAVLIK